MNRLKILVFDDTEVHRRAAVSLLGKDHDLTVVGTYDEAQKLLLPKYNEEFAKELFAEKYGDRDPYKDMEKSQRVERMDFFDSLRTQATTYPNFDVVLTDLLVPASSQALGGEGLRFGGQEMPLGTTIALLALCAGIKRVAVVTDKNHHHHPASAAFDCFKRHKLGDNLAIICTNNAGDVAIDSSSGELVDYEFIHSAEGEKKYPHKQEGGYHGIVRGKGWKKVLEQLMGEVEIPKPAF